MFKKKRPILLVANCFWYIYNFRLDLIKLLKASGHKTNARWFGWSPSQAYNGTLQKGEGDCDSDRDCARGLRCAHDRMRIPGVRNTGAIKWGRDFCYDPNGG